MLLSEAIRLGAMLSPQSRGGKMDEEGRCALGAAADALGFPGHQDGHFNHYIVPYAALEKAYPWLNENIEHPVLGLTTIMNRIWMMNDTDGMTREQIAEWLEGIEATLDPVHEYVQVQEGGG